MSRLRELVIVIIVAAATGAGAQTLTETAFERGWEIVARSHEALGGEAAARAARQVVIEAEGTLDRGARHQGLRPDASNPGAYSEWIVVDEARDRLGFQQVHQRYDGAIEHWRFVYSGEDLMRISDPVEKFAFEVREPSAGTKIERISRLVPQILVAEALENPSSLRWLGLSEVGDERVDFVSWSIDGESITLIVDHDTGLLRGVEAMVDETLAGDVTVRWIYGRYERVDGLGPFPSGYRIEMGGRVLKRVRFTTVRAGDVAGHAVFEIPEGLPVPETPPPATGDEGPAPVPRVIERAPWFWQVAGIRGGFNVAFFELVDGVAVFEAPAGWLEVHEIPPSNFTPGATSSSVSEELIRIVRETVPDKPIRFVVLSHFHGDHAGGVRAFVRAGATVVTGPGSADVIRRAAALPFRIGLEGAPAGEPRIRTVGDRLTLGSGDRRIEIVTIEPNPHVDEMLAIWVPSEKTLFVADLFHAQRLERYPSASELELQKSFIRWLDASGLAPERIYGVHGGAGTVEHLEKLRSER